MKVGGELVPILASRCLAAPTLARTVVGTDARLASDGALHQSPVRRSLAESVEEHNGRRSRADAVQVETVSIDEVGAPGRGGRVAGRRLGDRLECAAEG